MCIHYKFKWRKRSLLYTYTFLHAHYILGGQKILKTVVKYSGNEDEFKEISVKKGIDVSFHKT